MRPSFQARLINGPFDDPGLIVHCAHQRKTLLFDLGDLSALSPNDILKASHIFVTHTHIDHFIGFDQVLRFLLGRGKTVRLYGPEGFIKNVAGKLAAYTWNLVHNYQDALRLEVTEITERQSRVSIFDCHKGFTASEEQIEHRTDETVYQGETMKISAAVLDHQIPCLAFSLEEHFHVNILRPRLDELGLTVGPWLTEFKQQLLKGAAPDTPIEVPSSAPEGSPQTFALGDLGEKIVRITRGQKIAYVADAVYHPANEEKIIALAKGANHLFIEAAFLDAEHPIAKEKHHLTARQAGLIARKANVDQMTIFHHSPRYQGEADRLEAEARRAFEQKE